MAQNLFEDKLVVTAGKIDQSAFFDANRVANDETAQFLSTPLVNNPSIAFPDNGLGFNVTANPVEQIAISLGAGDAKAVADESGFNTLDGDEVFVGGEVTFNTEIAGHPGSYRAMVWHVNGGGGADGAGLAIGFDQQILEEGLFIFGRFGTADEDVAAYEIFASAGIGLEGIFGRADDMMAVGYAGGREAAAPQSEHILEMFYRLKLTDSIDITPDLQFLFDHAHQGAVVIGGLRLQITQ